MSNIDTLARRSASQLQAEVKTIPVPRPDIDRFRRERTIKTIRASVLAVAAVLIVIGVPLWIGMTTPDEVVTPPTTVPAPEPTVPDVQISEGMLTVETPLGTWQWVRDEEPGLGGPLPEDPVWVELTDPPLPEIEEMVWPQISGDFAGFPWDSLGGFPVSSGDVTITPAQVFGGIDWNRFYTNSDGWVEGRWRPLDGDCPWVHLCSVQTATLEILPVREEHEGGGVSYPVGGALEVLVASIVSGDPDAVEFRDEDTAELVLRVEANDDVTAQQLLRAGQFCVGAMDCGGGLGLWELYVDGVGWVEPPWHDLDLLNWPSLTAGVREGGFWIVGFEGPRDETTLHVWGSSDGVNWEEIASPVSLGDSFPNGFSTNLVDGEVVILTPASNPDGPPVSPKVLRLAEGELTEVDIDLSAVGRGQGVDLIDFSSTPWGWMTTTWIPDSAWGVCQVWVSADGSNWERITMPDGNDIGETVQVFTNVISEDGASLTAENPVPTSAEDVPADVTGSYCSIAEVGTVVLDFQHEIAEGGIEWEGERYRDFFSTSWQGGLLERSEQ